MAERLDLDDHRGAPAPAPEGSSCRGASAPQADLRWPSAAAAALKPEELRTFLSHLQAPHRLDTPQIRQLLAAHRRLPPSLSPTAVGHAAARLLKDKIAALDPGPQAAGLQRLPYQVLETCFLRGRKLFQAAPELGLSERQLSRERERALRLLAAEFAAPTTPGLAPEPLPSIEDHIQRHDLLRRLSDAAATQRLVSVTGEPGAGKTALVAALAHALGAKNVWWHRIRPGISDSLEALLFELGHVLAREGYVELRDYLGAALPDMDAGVATRLALEGLAGKRRLLVFDDFGAGDIERIAGWLREIVERLPNVSVVRVGAALADAVVVEVPPLSRAETATLFGDLDGSEDLAGLLGLSAGNARMVSAVVAWWRGEDWGLRALERHLEGRGPLANLADLTAFIHRRAA